MQEIHPDGRFEQFEQFEQGDWEMKFKVEIDLTGVPKEEVEEEVRKLFSVLQVQIWEHYKISKRSFK